nr:MAG TPA: hypothetical protein [Caudoviricetes sp.]
MIRWLSLMVFRSRTELRCSESSAAMHPIRLMTSMTRQTI